jgi:hypothetical protein
VVCTLGGLPSGSDERVEFEFEALQEGTFEILVTITAAQVDLNEDNNSHVIPVEIGSKADLSLAPHSSSRTIQPGQGTELRFEVENHGPSDAHNVAVRMSLPEGIQVEATHPACQVGAAMECSFGVLEGGEADTLEVTISFAEEGVFSSFLGIDGDEDDPAIENNEAGVDFIVEDAAPLFFPFSLHSGSPFPANPYAGVALFNPNDLPTDVEFTAYSASGQELAGVMLSDLEGRDTIPPMGQTALIPTEIFDLDNVSSVIAKGKPHAVKLFFMLGDYGLNTLDGVAGPLPEGEILFFPVARSNQKEAVVLFLFNSSSAQEVEVTLQLYDSNGVLTHQASRSLPAQGSFSETLVQLFGPEEIDGYVKVVSNGRVKGFELYSQSKGLSALAAQPAVEGNRLIAPHFFATQGGNTELRLQNLGEKFVDVAIKGYKDDGTLIGKYSVRLPRRESFVGSVTEFLPIEPQDTGIVTGYLTINMIGSFLSTPTVSGSVTFTGFEGNTIATLPLVPSGSPKTRFLHVAQSESLGMFTGLAILNLSETPTDLTIKIYNKTGKIVEEMVLDDLAPGSRIVDILSGSTFFRQEFQQVGGHIEVVSENPVVIFALFGDYGGRFLSAIEGQPF